MSADPTLHRRVQAPAVRALPFRTPAVRTSSTRALAARPVAVLAAAGLALTACSVGPEAESAGGAQGAGPSSSVTQAAPTALNLGDRPDQVMAEAAAARAATFGFIRQQAASAEEIRTAREDGRARAEDTGRTEVAPEVCAAPLAALDFSPILLDQEQASRVDVGAESFQGTGTVEVARLDGPGRQQVERHLQTVNRLLTDCGRMEMTVHEGGTSTVYVVQADAAALSEGSPAQSGLVWRRTRTGQGAPELTAQVLTAVTPDEVVMVSFAGQPAVGERQFTLMAEEVLAAALRAG
ncbi:hypothetical protein [Micrococcus sp.]|uniref:hypothetical protein n=1 Tax=Micrococcus sp. TaxID=1271 RepID=UPI002A909E1F|nr:hypothetical protein [Micrococcus sp.]MDY6054887.1 hypothetical protein [Micrococcus sp.]